MTARTVITYYLPLEAEATDVVNLRLANPRFNDAINDALGYSQASRSILRKELMDLGYYRETVEFMLPLGKRGRPARTGPWALLKLDLLKKLSDALGFEVGESAPEDWTPERIDAGADIATGSYENVHSRAAVLTNFRKALTAIGVDASRLEPANRQEIWAAKNDVVERRRLERAAEGIKIPPPYERIEMLVERARDFIDGRALVSAQTAADFLVVFSARPGELDTLDLGRLGGIVGSLKKRTTNADGYPIVSAIGEVLAREFMAAWKRLSPGDKAVAVSGLAQLCAAWGIQRRDLRAVGAALAVRAAVLATETPLTVGAQREIQRTALRHEQARAAPVDYYSRTVDSGARLAARFAELTPEQRAEVEALMRRFEKGPARA